MPTTTKDQQQGRLAEHAEEKARQAQEEAEKLRLAAAQEKARREYQEARDREREEQVQAEVARREAETVINRVNGFIERGATAFGYWRNEDLRGGQAGTPPIEFLAVASNLELLDVWQRVADGLDELVRLLGEKGS